MDAPSSDLAALAQRGYRFALALTHDPTQAADLIQDAWIAVLTAGGPWRAGYLLATIRNRFIDQQRHRQRIAFEPLNEDQAAVGPEPVWEDEALPDVGREAWERALAVLSAEERAALYLAVVEQYRVEQIAELLQRPRGTVLSLMHRARARLREALDPSKRITA